MTTANSGAPAELPERQTQISQQRFDGHGSTPESARGRRAARPGPAGDGEANALAQPRDERVGNLEHRESGGSNHGRGRGLTLVEDRAEFRSEVTPNGGRIRQDREPVQGPGKV